MAKLRRNLNYYLLNNNEKALSLYPTTPAEVVDYIKNLDIKKSVGLFRIQNRFLKELNKLFSIPISKIFNLFIEHGIFSQKMKIAIVIPVLKKDDTEDCNNYSPISLLPNISKLFEKLIKNRFSKFLEENCLFSRQFGFRNKHSRNHALIDLTETIRKAIDDNEFACRVFLDFKKVSDTVNHGILSKKLEPYWVRGPALKWFTSYLTGRKQYTNVNNIDSQITDISYGVPQGSFLGPFLFLIYINELNRAVTFSYIRNFADDANIIYRHKSLRKINQWIYLWNVAEWLRANRIALNTDKSKIVLFRAPQKPLTRKMNFRISGKDKSKNLGMQNS